VDKGLDQGEQDGVTTIGRRTRGVTVPILLSIIGSLIAFVAISLGLLWVTVKSAEHEALKEAGKAGELSARVALAPYLTAGLLQRNPTDVAALDKAGQTFIQSGNVVRLKVWSQSQQVLWSDERKLDGQYFTLEPDEMGLFASQTAIVDISNLKKVENTLEVAQGNTKLLEVYFGAKALNGEPVLVETYYPYSLVSESVNDLRARFLPLVIGGLALLTIAQVPVSIMLARRLSRSQRDREHLLERAINASDAERRRIAAEVHDGAVQDLIGISYSLEARAEAATGEMKEDLADLASGTRSTVRRLRSVLNSIYPVEVPERGWSEGFDDLVQLLEDQGVAVTREISDVRLAAIDELLLLRVTRESLRNVAAHAEAHHVVVSFNAQRMGRLVLEVTDDGQGFTSERADHSRVNGHLGLQLLHDLANDRGAELTIASLPGEGTSLRLELMGQR
jgi:signal transduction histidine kinase